MKMTLKKLAEAVGSLGNPSKMPGNSWGIPAKDCKRGSKLREKRGTVCHRCYALRGRYVFPGVQNALQYRLGRFNEMDRDEWCETMAALIGRKVNLADPYFRVFDSGDLQSEEMMIRWVLVAVLLPDVKFWMSTRERGIVNRAMKRLGMTGQNNLVVRVSSDMIGLSVPGRLSPHNSEVAHKVTLREWTDLVRKNKRARHHCPAPLQEHRCGDCRACWDGRVRTVVYLEG